MLYLVLGGIGWLIGALAYTYFSWFFGLALGLMAAEIVSLRRRLARVEEIRASEIVPAGQADATARQAAVIHPSPSHVAPRQHRDTAIPGDDARRSSPVTSVASGIPHKPIPSSPGVDTSGKESFSGIPVRVVDFLKNFFTTGNVVTKIGVIVLFFGFAFLLKYAAQRNMIPVEFRLIGVFGGGLALLGAGWRFRTRQMMYGLLLQGCGFGVLYLTIFAAARFYHLLPYGFSFAIMFCLVVLSGILAVLQDAKYLAITGIVGGFLAPVLMSTGSGSHVILFSFYALLNLGIVGIAWYKAWRELNLIGFIFTFVIASLWGGRYYRPEYFPTTEPFLVLFFLYYVAVSILHALRQPLNLRGYVDGTLVFGVPLAAFGLQHGLVRNFEYGLAISALGLGLFYILLATFLWRRRIDGLKMVTESFLAFGVVFGSLAIPLALDGRWTSAAWALEGGAILWIGIRQNRILPRLFGVLLQLGSGITFLLAMHIPSRQIPLVNSFFVGCMLISLAGLFSSWYLSRNPQRLTQRERHAEIPLMAWGLFWWFGAALLEIDRFVPWQDRLTVVLIHGAVSAMIMVGVSHRLSWNNFSYPALFLLPLMALAGLERLGSGDGFHLFARLGSVAWGIGFWVQYRLLYRCEKIWPGKIVPLWHQCTWWLLIFILTRETAYGVDYFLGGGQTWQYCAWGVVPGCAVLAMLSRGALLSWPIQRFHDAYFGAGTAIPVFYIFIWALLANFYHGDPTPLPFIPLFNPVEITQIFLLLLVFLWIERQEGWLREQDIVARTSVLKMVVHGAGFLLLNAMVARVVHFYADVPYVALSLFRSVLFQASLSILWGVTALVVTLGATSKGSRPAWLAGATILSLVVLKLFAVDLAGTGTVARIVSFLGVGSLMLLIGYFSPLPPVRIKEDS